MMSSSLNIDLGKLCEIFTGLGILQGVLDGLLQLIRIDLVDEVDLLQSLRPRQQSLLVPDDVAIVRARISGIDIQVDLSSD